MNDRYTKTVLTVIAGALAALAIEHATPAAQAQARGALCGSSHMTPCYVMIETGIAPLDVRVANSN